VDRAERAGVRPPIGDYRCAGQPSFTVARLRDDEDRALGRRRERCRDPIDQSPAA